MSALMNEGSDKLISFRKHHGVGLVIARQWEFNNKNEGSVGVHKGKISDIRKGKFINLITSSCPIADLKA